MTVKTERAFLAAMAQRLHDANVGVYRPNGGYVATDTAIVFGPLPSNPDRVIALTLYLALDAQVEARSVYRMQVRMRGKVNDSLDPGDLSDAIFPVLHGIVGVDLTPDIHCVDSRRLNISPQGIDGNRRTERADNYEFILNLPTTPVRPE